ncbi:MAG: GntR family transcriptional regulator [Lentisphaerae bacterium]|nr:MAG: GntR family transcriptional regulator [Lentisphaerota bacterium]
MVKQRNQFKYKAIANTILEAISEGRLKPGDRLPSLRQLAEENDCNYLTVYHAFEELQQQGILEKRPGSGTFIAPNADLSKPVQQKRKNTYLLIFHALSEPGFFPHAVLKSLCTHCKNEKIHPVFVPLTPDGIDVRSLHELHDRLNLVGGIIPTLPDDFPVSTVYQLVQTSPAPVVIPHPIPGLEDYYFSFTPQSSVRRRSTTTRCCRFFHRLGCRHIALLGVDPPTTYHPFHRNIVDYTHFCNEHAMPTLIRFVRKNVDCDFDSALASLHDYRRNLGVICFYDDLAIRLIHACHKQGWKIPQDIRILGNNNNPDGECCDPPLSTVRFDIDHMTGKMLHHVFALAENRPKERSPHPPPQFIIRQSCGALAQFGGDRQKLEAFIAEVMQD